jgi:FKBP-type peptidyl-prolyl cis-trans isomerase
MKKLTKNEWIAVSVGLAVVVIFVFYSYFNNFTNQFPINMDQQQAAENNGSSSDQTAGPATGLSIKDVLVGTGEMAAAGDTVTVNYVGTFPDGTKFDSSYDRNQPFSFILGEGQVIAGWDQGVAGMRIGGKRHLVVPPQLGYGPNDYGPIPGNSTLIFDVVLLKVVHPAR